MVFSLFPMIKRYISAKAICNTIRAATLGVLPSSSTPFWTTPILIIQLRVIHHWIDLFGWGMWLDEITDKAKITNTSTNNSEYAPTSTYNNDKMLTTNNDFTNNHRTVDGELWMTLTRAEWNYLINTRTNATKLCGVATVNGVNGLILLPDEWSETMSCNKPFKSGVASDGGKDYYKTVNEYTAAQWTEMEALGAVFLPAAGSRYGASVSLVGRNGHYWSSTTVDAVYSRFLYFGSDDVSMNFGRLRSGSRSVRLVRFL